MRLHISAYLLCGEGVGWTIVGACSHDRGSLHDSRVPTAQILGAL